MANNMRLQKALINPDIAALMYRLGQHDLTTLEHSLRVGGYMNTIVDNLTMSETLKSDWVYAALLHDIGKLTLPKGVLQKPGKLEDYERMIIYNHGIIGSNILENGKFSSCVLDGVTYHHERLDGKGYPNGINESQIPGVAKMLAVLDSYDAMLNRRSYKEPYPRMVVMRELRSLAGIAYCAECVKLIDRLIF